MRTRRIVSLILVTLSSFAVEWHQAGWGGGGYYWAAAFHPVKDGVIYMAGDCCGVYKTEDHGRQWRIINTGLASYAVYSIAVDPTHPDTVYAATEQGLCKSVNAGESWQLLPHTGPKELRLTGERERSFRALAIDPKNGNTLYAASPSGKICKSSDGGQTWNVAYSKSFASEPDGAVRIQFGKINGEYYGDFALPVAFPSNLSPRDCHSIGFTLSGEGAIPKDCYLMVRTKTGATYRSPNLNTTFGQSNWHDVLLTSRDFIPDPQAAKANPNNTVPPFSDADWPSIVRLDLACSGALPDHATIGKFKTFFFSGVVPSQTVKGIIRDFATDANFQKFGNIHVGPPRSGAVYGVAIAPSRPTRILAATHDDGLLLSDNAGQSWTVLNAPKPAAAVAIDPTNPDVIYGAFFTKGIMKSSDGGKTWGTLSCADQNDLSMIDIAIHPQKPQEISAIGSKNWNGVFFHSATGGASWDRSSKITADTSSNPTRDGLYNGIASLSSPRMIALAPNNPEEIFLAANWRPCFSMDGGKTWSERNRNTDISCITDIRFHNGKTYVTAMDEGTFVSDNKGEQWRQLWPLQHTPGLSGHNWRVAINDVDGQTRIISTVTPWYKTPTCVVRSADGGKTFSVILAGLPDYSIYPNTMWGQGHPRALAVDLSDPQIVYLGIDGDPSNGKNGGGLFRSNDGGVTWKQLPNQPGSRRMFYGLSIDPTNHKRLYWGACGTGGGVWRSDDQGESWTHIFKQECFIWNVQATPQGTLYCSGQQLWRSDDHGTTWRALTTFKGEWSVVAFEINPLNPDTLWIATTTWDSRAVGGIFKSMDAGKSWQEITGNIPCVKPQILRYNPDTHELWAGHVGLYKCQQ